MDMFINNCNLESEKVLNLKLFTRCEENPLDMLKSVVAGAVAMATKNNKTQTHEVTMATQQNEPLWIRRIFGSVQVRDETEEDRKRYCGDPCITLVFI